MSKVLIELEDNPDGTVTVAVTPPAASLMEKHYNTVKGLTAAESYGLHVVNQLRETAKDQRVKTSPLAIPGKLNPY